MKLRVTVDGIEYDVAVYDINSRPVIAVVDGVEIEVWPETDQPPTSLPAPGAHNRPPSATQNAAALSQSTPGGTSASLAKTVLAPLPGVILSIKVEDGSQVTAGQELCVIEAMKMKNIVRSSRPGTVEKIHVHVGQTVQHRDSILDFADA